jgi:hypothetical protein
VPQDPTVLVFEILTNTSSAFLLWATIEKLGTRTEPAIYGKHFSPYDDSEE